MNIRFEELSVLRIAASAIAFSLLGGVWFGALMARVYAAALDRPDILGQKPSTLALAGPFVCSVVVSLTNALLLPAFGAHGAAQSALFGLAVGLGYLAPMVVNIAINPNFPRPFLYSAVNVPYFLAGNVVSCLILGAGR